MPELPEVETVLRGLAPVIEGQKITKATVNRPDLRWPFPENMAPVSYTHLTLPTICSV